MHYHNLARMADLDEFVFAAWNALLLGWVASRRDLQQLEVCVGIFDRDAFGFSPGALLASPLINNPCFAALTQLKPLIGGETKPEEREAQHTALPTLINHFSSVSHLHLRFCFGHRYRDASKYNFQVLATRLCLPKLRIMGLENIKI